MLLFWLFLEVLFVIILPLVKLLFSDKFKLLVFRESKLSEEAIEAAVDDKYLFCLFSWKPDGRRSPIEALIFKSDKLSAVAVGVVFVSIFWL